MRTVGLDDDVVGRLPAPRARAIGKATSMGSVPAYATGTATIALGALGLAKIKQWVDGQTFTDSGTTNCQ